MATHESNSTVGSGSKTSSQGCDTPIDADSLSGSEICSTVSVTGDVWRFEKENGRTYHGYRAGVYYYPNDSSEAERLEYQSCVIDFALHGALHLAPLSDPITILDIGTGTGAWAIQMGDLYPNATIEATDLSPIQPTNVPDNVQFIIDDAAEEDWAVPENHYDYIHTRVMMGCFEDFREIIRRGFKYTKPGGWMESLECMHPPYCDDGTMPDDWPFKEWTKTMDEAAMNAGRPLRIATRLKKWYTEVGFEDVHERVIKIPINRWPRDPHLKQLGTYWAENLLAGLQGFTLALFSRIYLVKVRKSITDPNVHAYTKVYTVWGRKPDPSKPSTNSANKSNDLGLKTNGDVSQPTHIDQSAVSVPASVLPEDVDTPMPFAPATISDSYVCSEALAVPLPASPTMALSWETSTGPEDIPLPVSPTSFCRQHIGNRHIQNSHSI
ncbi:hypothetical protein G7Y89_g7243 [Cudoniella acicularis]|uniref:S-adenosyl-L-methionine-dependent methyltransferase n=1 Tax=Cudoniella acicularis TaxID=354080 RepID=A0A8H4RLA1_9HELO|nr:hypothetical protein G7Y89_g7243 [Cudoniella acicularis]